MACCFQCIPNAEIGVVERLGKYQSLAQPGWVIYLFQILFVFFLLFLRLRYSRSFLAESACLSPFSRRLRCYGHSPFF